MRTDRIKAKAHRSRHLFWSGIASLKTDGIIITAKKVAAVTFLARRLKYWIEEELFTEEELGAQRNKVFDVDIKFSFVVPLYNTKSRFLKEMIDSVRGQTYANWELCLADGSDGKGRHVEKICREYAKNDERIKYKKLSENKGISGNSNEALAMVSGDYISLLDHDDILHPAALHETMLAVCDGADFIYTDEAVFESPDKTRVRVIHFKPDFGPDSILGNNFLTHFTSFKRELLERTGGFRSEYDGSQDHELFLRLTYIAEHITHIPEVLYYWRAHSDSVADNIGNKNYAVEAGVRAVEDNLKARGIDAKVEPNERHGAYYRVHYPINGNPKISIVIPNYEHLDDLRKCVESVLDKTTYKNNEIIIVENNSNSKEIFDYYDSISSKFGNIKVIKWDGPFNYSAINNYAVREAVSGDYIVLLNNDTEVITPEWIEEMLMYAQRTDVGAVGAKLYFPDSDTVQHAGVILGLGGVAGHISLGSPKNHAGYMGRNIYAQNLSAVTAACMMIRRDVWEEVDGLDESFAVAYNDVDLCVKIRKAGYLIVWTPFAELYHYESKSRGYNNTLEKMAINEREVALFRKKWSDVLEEGDPYYNPNLSLDRTDYAPKQHLYHAYKRDEKNGCPIKKENKLSVVIPCYNEKDNIRTIVDDVLASPIENKEIIIVDDCSTDGTREVLEKEISPLVSKIIYHKVNQGKGASLRTGFKHATGEVVIVQDADLEYDPKEYPKVVEPIFDGKAEVVYGSRFLNKKRKGYLANRLANRTLTSLSNMFTHQKLTDMETCYKAFKREIIQSIDIKENRFGFEPEITSKIAKKGIKIMEVPISYYPRSLEEGKKIGIKDGLRAIYVICRHH